MVCKRFLKSVPAFICLVVRFLHRADRAVSVQIDDGVGIKVGHGDGCRRSDHARRTRRMRDVQVPVNNLRVWLRSRSYPHFMTF